MRPGLRVAAVAGSQIRTASDWWRRNRPEAPELFRQELERGFELIATKPDIGAPALDPGLEGVRRLHLYRVHYHLYYRVRAEAVVEVLALWHTSRGESPQL